MNDSPPTILLRCDGNSSTGLGHLSRSLALAEALGECGARCLFLGHYEEPALRLLGGAGVSALALEAPSWSDLDGDAVIAKARELGASGLVVDSYVVGSDWLARVEAEAAPVLLVDDFAALAPYRVSALVNFTIRAERLPYPRDGVRCYLGLRWLLCRAAIRRLRAGGLPPSTDVRRVLVAAGGNDPHDIALPSVNALLQSDRSLSIHVVVGASYAKRDELSRALAGFAGETRILTSLPSLATEFAWADLCLSSSGLTRYEASYVGLPAAALAQNEGQHDDAQLFARFGLAWDLGLASAIDPDRLAEEVDRLVHDRALRRSLQERSAQHFPVDPTRDLAASALREVFRVR